MIQIKLDINGLDKTSFNFRYHDFSELSSFIRDLILKPNKNA